jgi:hypothetical protein
MYNCKNNCNRLCPNFVPSTSITVVAIDGVDTLVIDIPTGVYGNGCQYCIFTLQAIPEAATVNMPVAISIGGDTTTVYPLVACKTCIQATASQVRTRTRYCTVVQTNTVSGVFKAYSGLSIYCPDVLASLPIVAVTPPAGG